MTPRRYRPNPDARIYAAQWTGDPTSLPADWLDRDMFDLDEDGTLLVRTNQGIAVCPDDWHLIFGTAAEFYPVPAAILAARWVLDADLGDMQRYRPNLDARLHAVQWRGGLSSIPGQWRERFTVHGDALMVPTRQGDAMCYLNWLLCFDATDDTDVPDDLYPVPPAIFHGRWILDD
jgi:hypothetical protein